MTEEILEQPIGEPITDGTTEEQEEDDELVQALREALELAGDAIAASEAIEGLGVEAKGARTFANQIRRLAESAEGPNGEVLSALAIVVARSRPEEWPVLAAILLRLAPKAQREGAEKIANGMQEEGKVGYAKPDQQYPAQPKEKSADAASLQPPTESDLASEVKSIVERVEALMGLASKVEELGLSVEELKKRLALVAPLVITPKPVPMTRETAQPAAALLVESLTRK